MLIDLQSVKSTANQDDRSRFVLLQLRVVPLSVVSLLVELVTQLYAVTFNKQGAFQAAVDTFRQQWTSLGGVWLGLWQSGDWCLDGQLGKP